ncbi:Uncharacterised protein [Fusobacterium polymorphum]|uniref:Uncharacterized protein n=1 Tax=Fusobacterium polymorphum ATCC 10953 TaxID=393480 RepID=A5TS70_FUSNP|nr:hypothetical protein [Fusobacterium polymorphum]EDK87745.1 hypothetical protein FNP_2356 [Fusobacterium polymorphum ATCC 10953]UTI53140.1 hypothetical protein NLJ26_00360 [Fusobacterium polymorphum]WRL67656.1 hypothetical protein VKN78_07400 [Fusobacterium polymorphum]CKG61125.1 Uncharacterised protein [Fusobacterium polymorphum]
MSKKYVNYEEIYEKFNIKSEITEYLNAEDCARKIKKCTLLKKEEIEYSNFSRVETSHK